MEGPYVVRAIDYSRDFDGERDDVKLTATSAGTEFPVAEDGARLNARAQQILKAAGKTDPSVEDYLSALAIARDELESEREL
jgi:hypothetical protein